MQKTRELLQNIGYRCDERQPAIRSSREALAIGFFALSMAGCGGSNEPQLDTWAQRYPALPGARMSPHLLVLKCTYSDEPSNRAIPGNLPPILKTLDQYISTFMGGQGAGSLLDYYRDVSYGAIAMDSEIRGWYDAPFPSSMGGSIPRPTRVEQCANAIPDEEAKTLSFGDYTGIVAIMNDSTDGGACADGPIPLVIHGSTYNVGCATFDRASLYTAFAAHEVGHILGLHHSYDDTTNICGNGAAPGEYCDPYDVMSALVTNQFSWPNFPPEGAETTGGAGPGLNVPNLLFLDALPQGRIASYHATDGAQTVVLSALSKPVPFTALALEIFGPTNGDAFTVEYRQPSGWDQGFPGHVVLIHKFSADRSQPYAYLQEGPMGGARSVGDVWMNAAIGVTVRVQSIDPTVGTATLVVEPD